LFLSIANAPNFDTDGLAVLTGFFAGCFVCPKEATAVAINAKSKIVVFIFIVFIVFKEIPFFILLAVYSFVISKVSKGFA
jgi:hypothetical protein